MSFGTTLPALNCDEALRADHQFPTMPASEKIWNELYALDPAALASQSPDWGKVLVAAGGFRSEPQHFTFSEGLRAVLPLYTKGIGKLRYAWSPPPAWGFGGPLSEQPLTPSHVDAILALVETLPYIGFHIRPNPLDAAIWDLAAKRPGWTATPRFAHVVDLEGGVEEVRKRFKSGTRTNIRRAEKLGVEVIVGHSQELIDDFYTLRELSFARWARMQNEPGFLTRLRGWTRDPRSKFETMAKLLGDRFRLYVARMDGKPIGAILVLMGHQAHYTRGVMDEVAAGESRASYLLQSMAIEDACRAGCSHYHMGESGSSASLAQFKSRFGAIGLAYAEYRYERLPLARIDQFARNTVKRVLGFRDV